MATQPETTFPSSLAVRDGHVTTLQPMGYKQKYFVPFLGQGSKKHAACAPLFPSFLLVRNGSSWCSGLSPRAGASG